MAEPWAGKTVVIVSRFFPPSGNPQAQQSWRLAVAISQVAARVIALTAGSAGQRYVNDHLPSQKQAETERLIIEQADVRRPLGWLSLMPAKGRRFLRPTDESGIGTALGERLTEVFIREQVDVICSIAEPLASHVATTRCAKYLGNARRVFWFSDPVPLSGDAEMMKLRWRRRRCEQLVKDCLGLADAVVAPTEEILKPLLSLAGSREVKFHTLPHMFDACDWPWPPQTGRTGDRIGGALEVLHSGALYWRRTPWTLLEGVRLLNARENRIVARVILQGAMDPQIADTVRTFEPDGWLTVAGSASESQAQESLRLADIACVIDPQGSARHLPSKVADCVGACRPILFIGQKDAPTHRLLRRLSYPAFYHAESPEGVAAGITALAPRGVAPRLEEFRPSYEALDSTTVVRTLGSWLFDRS